VPRILVQNEKDTIEPGPAVADLRTVLEATDPDIGFLLEWPGDRDRMAHTVLAFRGYVYGRPPHGGPVFWRRRREKRRLGRRARRLTRHGRTVRLTGDSNFAGMVIGGFHDCWEGYSGGDLGGRPVTAVYSTDRPTGRPQTVKTRSDHLAVVASYP
jgi:hypothetical protein